MKGRRQLRRWGVEVRGGSEQGSSLKESIALMMMSRAVWLCVCVCGGRG